MKNTLISGASHKKTRFSNKAMHLLMAHGHKVFLYHPKITEIEGIPVVQDLSDIVGKIDTITLYVRPEILKSMSAEVLSVQPKRIIFNPGTEDAVLMDVYRQAGIEVLEACTLVMLESGDY
jgi:hypothetical protein